METKFSEATQKLISVFKFEPSQPGIYILRFEHRKRDFKNYTSSLNELDRAGLLKLIEKTSKTKTYQYTGE